MCKGKVLFQSVAEHEANLAGGWAAARDLVERNFSRPGRGHLKETRRKVAAELARDYAARQGYAPEHGEAIQRQFEAGFLTFWALMVGELRLLEHEHGEPR